MSQFQFLAIEWADIASAAMRAEGKVISIGRRVAFAEGRIVDSDGKLYASSTSTLLVFDLPTQ